MRLRQLVLACSLASLSWSAQVNALGLGEIKLKSLLNQPLEAEIQLLDTRDLSPEQIIINLASPADFERNGIDRLHFYSELQFSVDLNAPQGPLVRVTSRTPVKEPYLNVLVEARWTAGRLLREYTLLMDLPTFDEERKPVVSQLPAARQPAVENTQIQSRPAPKQAGLPALQPVQSAPVSRRTSQDPVDGSYRVQANDTLWEIASRARADGNISVYQSMMALYKANPDAFINGNINRLRRGEVLRIPTSDEMRQLSRSLAATEFSQVSNDTALGAQINASRRATTAPASSSDVSGRVKLSASQASGSEGGAGSGSNSQNGSANAAQLAATLEELDKAKAENSDLNNRVKSLEAQIETMERLIAVSNEKLRSLQVNAEQSNQAEQQPAEPVSMLAEDSFSSVGGESSEASSLADVADGAVNGENSVVAVVPSLTASSASEVSSAAASSVAAANRVVMPAPKEPTLLEKLEGKAPLIGGGLLVLLGAGYWFYRRRQQEEDVGENELYEQTFESPQDANQDATQIIEDSYSEAELSDDTVIQTVAQTNDVVGEADIYIAYGKLDQAESLLLNALEKDESNVDVRAKLLEIYSQQENLTAFDRHYSALVPLVGVAALSQFADWRQAFDGDVTRIKPFSDVSEESVEPTDVSLDLSDFDLALHEDELQSDELADEKLVEDDSALTELSDFSFEFDDAANDQVTLKEDDLSVADSSGAASLSIADDFNLDLEIDEVDLAALDTEINALDDQLISSGDVADESDLLAAIESGETSVLPLVEEDLSFMLDEGSDLSAEATALFEDQADDIQIDDEDLFAEIDLDEEVASKVEETLALDSLFEENDNEALSLADEELVVDEILTDSTDDLSFEALSIGEAAPEEIQVDKENVVGEDFSVDQLFTEALAELDSDDEGTDVSADGITALSEHAFNESDDLDADLDFLADADETATKLDLARAYIDMGDAEGAREILSEVIAEGNDEQKQDAESLLSRIV